MSPNPPVARIPIKDESVVKQARFVEVGSGEYLVIAGQRSLQIYTADGKKCLHVEPVLGPGTPEAPSFYRGIAACNAGGEDFICVGTSSGEIALIPATGGMFGHPFVQREQTSAICDLDAQTHPEIADEALVASADSNGQLLLLLVSQGGRCGVYGSFGGDPNALCTSLRIRKQWLLSAYCTGHVRIHDVLSKCVVVQVAAHARWINALEVHPVKDIMATAAEDCTVSVWRLPEDGGSTQIKHIASVVVPDAVLCGVAFSAGTKDHVACTAYDVEAVHGFQLD
jgi:WD40 repeat protein